LAVNRGCENILLSVIPAIISLLDLVFIEADFVFSFTLQRFYKLKK